MPLTFDQQIDRFDKWLHRKRQGRTKLPAYTDMFLYEQANYFLTNVARSWRNIGAEELVRGIRPRLAVRSKEAIQTKAAAARRKAAETTAALHEQLRNEVDRPEFEFP